MAWKNNSGRKIGFHQVLLLLPLIKNNGKRLLIFSPETSGNRLCVSSFHTITALESIMWRRCQCCVFLSLEGEYRNASVSLRGTFWLYSCIWIYICQFLIKTNCANRRHWFVAVVGCSCRSSLSVRVDLCLSARHPAPAFGWKTNASHHVSWCTSGEVDSTPPPPPGAEMSVFLRAFDESL